MSFFSVFTREVNRLLKNRYILIIMIVIPLVMSVMVCETFKTGTPKNLPIAVLDNDNSVLSRQLVRMIQATPTCNVDFNVTNLTEGKDLIVEGSAYALIVVPKDFQRDIYRGEQPKLVFYYNNQMILIGGSISKDVTTAVQTFMTGMDLKVRMKKGTSSDVAMTQVNLISVDEHIRSNPYLNYSYFLAFGAFAHISQILITFVTIWAFGSEFKAGTSKEWLAEAGNSIIIATFGKMLPYFVGFSLVMSAMYLIYFGFYQAPFVGSIGFVVFATLVFIFAYQILGIMFVAITANMRLSLSCGAFYTAMGFAFAGVTFPIIAMPVVAKIYSWLLPLSHYMSIMVDQVLRGIPPIYDVHSIGEIFVLTLPGLALLPRLKKFANDETKWYKS